MKLIITAEVENFEDEDVMSLQIITIQRGFLSRICRNWRKITYKPAVVTNLEVETS